MEKILSIIALEWEVILIQGKNILDDRESRNSLVALCCLYFNKLTLKSPRKETAFCSLASVFKSELR